MATKIKITYDHEGVDGCVRYFFPDYILETNRGDHRADDIRPGDMVQTTPRHKTLVRRVETVTVEE